MTVEGGKYKFVSNFLPAATSFGSNLRAFQSSFPNSTSNPVTVITRGPISYVFNSVIRLIQVVLML